ncbi:MAG TPA: MFS transporter, partial [Arthrobacter sp.]|nr:MFS transporter [Arthrobacter sp.]
MQHETATSTTGRRSGRGLGIAAAGMLLIATTYGMARFGVGLFAPYLAAQRPELVGVLGAAAAAQFTAYSLAAALSIRWADRHPRWGLALAGATATIGCAGIAAATEPGAFITAVLVAGLGGGFASPALVPVMDAVVAPEAAATAQSVVNAGTAVGVIGAGGVAFTASTIGPAWLLMALACAATGAALWLQLREQANLRPVPAAGMPPALSSGAWRTLAIPAAAALVAGVGSSLTWTFGPLLVTSSGTVDADRLGWLWVAVGLGGF